MPNDIESKLYIVGDKKQKLDCLKCLYSEDTIVDFNSIIPMPKCLNVGDYSCYSEGIAKQVFEILGKRLKENTINEILNILSEEDVVLYKKIKDLKDSNQKKISRDRYKDFLLYLNNIKTTGYATWHDWRLDNWGTKWNSYRASYSKKNFNPLEEKNIDKLPEYIQFSTAWDVPGNFIIKLSMKYPNLEFRLVPGVDFDDSTTFKNGIVICYEQDAKSIDNS